MRICAVLAWNKSVCGGSDTKEIQFSIVFLLIHSTVCTWCISKDSLPQPNSMQKPHWRPIEAVPEWFFSWSTNLHETMLLAHVDDGFNAGASEYHTNDQWQSRFFQENRHLPFFKQSSKICVGKDNTWIEVRNCRMGTVEAKSHFWTLWVPQLSAVKGAQCW